ncbi:MAG TPA: chemotaxis protein CheW [Desulfuromonadaceae bacterium]
MTGAGDRYLVFTLPGRRYAVDLAQVAEVEEPPTLWPIPGAPPCYPGAMNFHGSIVAVLNLSLFLGSPVAPRPEKVIVLDPAIASLALLVERVESIVPADRVRSDDREARQSEEPWSSGSILLPDGAAAVLLDVAELVREATERIAAA